MNSREATEPLLALAECLVTALSVSDVERDTDKSDRPSVFECGAPECRYPTLYAILDSNDTIFDRIDAAAFRIEAARDRLRDALLIVRVNGALPNVVIDIRIRRQAPHRFQPRIPFKCTCGRVPRIR
jgi:hypothetical protein